MNVIKSCIERKGFIFEKKESIDLKMSSEEKEILQFRKNYGFFFLDVITPKRLNYQANHTFLQNLSA